MKLLDKLLSRRDAAGAPKDHKAPEASEELRSARREHDEALSAAARAIRETQRAISASRKE